MIFVYPAIISDSVDSKIAPAIAKTLEQYFLLHIQEAISNNDIRIATRWKQTGDLSGDGTYGPLFLVTENKLIKGKSLLEFFNTGGSAERSKVKDEYDKLFRAAGIVINRAHQHDLKVKGNSEYFGGRKISEIDDSELNSIIDEMNDGAKDINETISDISKVSAAVESLISEIDKHIYKDERLKLGDIRTQLTHTEALLNAKLENIKKDIEICQRSLGHSGARSEEERKQQKGMREKSKEEREEEKREEEKRKQYEIHGNYKVEIVKGVSLKPTMANMQVVINYQGGPYRATERIRTPAGTVQEISIGTKVLPLKLMNFDKIEDAILNDYFMTSAQSLWHQYSRSYLRIVSKKLGAWLQKYLHIDFDLRSKMDPIKANILLAPHGFVNASSSFERKGNMPSFYKYSAAIVIIDKRDLLKEEGANFFLDKSQVQRMFKLGWNSFCILDETKEEALFVSSIDGGFLHVIPYSYIFNSLGMDQVYQNVNDLRKKASPFRTSVGKMSNLIQRLKKESRLLEAIRLHKKVK